MPTKDNMTSMLLRVRHLIGRIIFRISPAIFNFLVKAYNTSVVLYAYYLVPRRKLFEKVYDNRVWGAPEEENLPFYSGQGTHDISVVNDYLQGVDYALNNFCSIHKPDVVDLGCGDFNIGSKLRPFFGKYIACDLVQPLIKYNQDYYKHLDVDFRFLDAVSDILPPADVIIIRQVLQHLSNRDIKKILNKVWANYRYLLLTEHIPAAKHFHANVDIYSGGNIRLQHDSGVVITEPPFLYKPVFAYQVAASHQLGGVIQTIWYQIR